MAEALGGLMLGLGLTMAPWLLHTWSAVGQPVVSPHFIGRNFYTSNGPGVAMESDGYYGPAGIHREPLRRLDREKSPADREAHLFSVAAGHIARRPGEFARRVGFKFVNM